MTKQAVQATQDQTPNDSDQITHERRDFMSYVAVGMGVVGTGAFMWPVIDSMNPSADVLALSSIEVDLSMIEVGQSIVVKWRGKPVFIRHRTADEIAKAQQDDNETLIDPQSDEARVVQPEWLVMVGICTHLGCIPLGNNAGDPKGEFGGWFCPCHGSHYDTSGRIRKGPAPTNLAVPEYDFISDNIVKIG
ncbi:MAG: ubiquinol-cytochrome c reductase iron-sulfur subunit [Alphaproteobacteria bacterium]